MRFKWLSIVFLLSLFCMSFLGSPGYAKAPFPNGIGVCAHFTGAPAKDLDLIQQAGFDTIRTDLKWGQVESTKGVYNWAAADTFINGLLARNIRPYLILDYNNLNYGAATELTGISTDAQRTGYKNFAVAAVTRYAGKGIIWELWNEPNLGQFWNPGINPADYVAMVKATAPAMRSADPNCYIVAPAVAFVDTIFDFLKYCGANGVFSLIDAVSVHPYANAAPESGNLDYLYGNVRTIIQQYNPSNPNLPIVGGEFGFSTVWSGMDATKEGNYLARQVLYHNAHGIPVSMIYDYINDGTSTTDPEANFGLLNQDYSVKPAYTVMQSLNTNLKGATFDQKLTSAANDYYYQYLQGTNKIIAMWTTGAAHSVTYNGTAITISEKPLYVKIGTTPTPTPTPTVPAAPSSLNAVSITKDATTGIYYANMTWADNSTNETNFQVQQSINSTTAFSTVASPAANSTSVSVNIGTAPTQGTYYFKVLAVNATGSSAASNVASINVATTTPTPTPTVPAAPSNLNAVSITKDATTGIYYANMTWADNSNNETNFQVQRSINSTAAFSVVASPAANSTSVSVNLGTAPTQGTYYFKVLAVNAAGSSTASNVASINVATVTPTPTPTPTPTGAIAAPSNLHIVSETKDPVRGIYYVNMTWSDNSNNETNFLMQQSIGSTAAFKIVATPGTNNTQMSVNIGTAPTWGPYYFRILAVNAAGASQPSNVAGINVAPIR